MSAQGALTARILRVWRSADAEEMAAGLDWYATAQAHADAIARDNGIAMRTAAGIIAALSPQVSWKFNLEWAREVAAGSPINRGLNSSQGKAMAILYRGDDSDPLDILGGPKVRAFYQCIISAGIADAVCIDRHAYDIVTNRRGSFNSLTPKRIRTAQNAYRRAARRLQSQGVIVTAAQVQAVTWVAWRNRYQSAGAYDPRELDRAPMGAF